MNRKFFLFTQTIVSLFVASSVVASAAPAPTTSGNPAKPQNPAQPGGQTVTGGVVQSPAQPLSPLGTNWTYQGRLQPAPADGPHNFTFTLYDSGGSPIGVSSTSANVSNGYFTADVDFGSDSFNGESRSLGVAVDSAPIGSPQPITPAPYAITALNLAPGEDVVGARSDPMLGLVNSIGPALSATSTYGLSPAVYGLVSDGSATPNSGDKSNRRKRSELG